MSESILTVRGAHKTCSYLAGLLALALLPGARLCFAAQSADATAPLPQVTVESPRERALRRQVDHFITAVIVQPSSDAFDRWSIPICPLVAGLPKAFGELILERISKAAADAHAPLAGKDCRPDLFVVAHNDVGQLLKTWWARDPMTYNYHDQGIGAVKHFFRSKQPIRAWYNTRWEDSGDGDCMPEMPAAALGSHVPQGIDVQTCTGRASRLTYASTGANIVSAVIVIDMGRMKGMTTRQLADYIALIGLADVRLDADPSPVPSILELFGHATPPQGLTQWDRALLYSLYDTSREDRLQLPEMETTMVSRVAP
jgi:hypothetical protein